MKRRDFLKAMLAAGLAAQKPLLNTARAAMPTPDKQIPRRPYRAGVELSIIGMGGMVLCGLEQKDANAAVAQSIERGVNYFDVAPTYGSGEAEEKLGPALEPHRGKVFLACKTAARDAKGAEKELEQSLKRLRTDHVDLYQFHGVANIGDAQKILGPGGAAELFLKARQQGKARFLGFSAHSEDAALALLDGFPCDSVLFPVNFVCYAQEGFGPRVLAHAKNKGAARLALKSLAYTVSSEESKKKFPKCWYAPVSDRELARQAMRFTLSEGVTALVPPGDNGIYQMALELAQDLPPLTADERKALLASTQGVKPIFST